jgi:hypothetical protein
MMVSSDFFEGDERGLRTNPCKYSLFLTQGLLEKLRKWLSYGEDSSAKNDFEMMILCILFFLLMRVLDDGFIEGDERCLRTKPCKYSLFLTQGLLEKLRKWLRCGERDERLSDRLLMV